MAGLAVLVIDLYWDRCAGRRAAFGPHARAHGDLGDRRSPACAGAPVRLAFYSLPRRGRRTLARWLQSRSVSAITTPTGFDLAVLRGADSHPPPGHLRVSADQSRRPRD